MCPFWLSWWEVPFLKQKQRKTKPQRKTEPAKEEAKREEQLCKSSQREGNCPKEEEAKSRGKSRGKISKTRAKPSKTRPQRAKLPKRRESKGRSTTTKALNCIYVCNVCFCFRILTVLLVTVLFS
eukprot:1009926_1